MSDDRYPVIQAGQDTLAPAAGTGQIADPHAEEQAAVDLLNTTIRLIEVLEREIDMLREMRPDEMQALQEDKIVLAAAYESQLKRLRVRPEFGPGLDPELKDELRHATDVFQAVLVDNERALRAARTATDGVLQAVVEASGRAQQRAGYAANGTASAKRARHAQSVAVNERL